LNTSTSKLTYQLNSIPRNFAFINEDLWFLDSAKGLGNFYPKKNKSDISYKNALLHQWKNKNKETIKKKDKKKDKKKNKRTNKKGENTFVFSSHDDDIWYSHRSQFKENDKNNRLYEVCVSHYSIKYKTIKRYTRREMGLEAKHDCTYLAVSRDQVWLSHNKKEAGLSVYNTATKQWKHISASTNNLLIGGGKIMLDNDHLWMMINNQLIGLNTKTMHANVILGDAVISQPWHSSFYVKNGYAWFATKESTNKKPIKSNLVLYKIPINPNERQVSLSKLD
jgi:hypothetical protein